MNSDLREGCLEKHKYTPIAKEQVISSRLEIIGYQSNEPCNDIFGEKLVEYSTLRKQKPEVIFA